MKIFMAKLRDLVGTGRNPQPWAPRDLLFRAQRHFLERMFDLPGIRRQKVSVEVPDDGGAILFKCEVSLRSNPYATITGIAQNDWGGEFEVKAVRIREADEHDPTWLKVTFVVDTVDAKYRAKGGSGDGRETNPEGAGE